MIVIGYGISVLFSFLLIRMGFALDEDIKNGKEVTGDILTHWFVVMLIPGFNVIISALAAFSLLYKKVRKNNVTASFLKHLFLSRKQIKKK